jgi:hypothetical protein
MCYADRKIPESTVGILSILLLVCAVAMVLLAMRFNSNGLREELGGFDNYANFAFITLIGASAFALIFSICGLCIWRMKNKMITVCFGVMLLPTAIVMAVYGFILTGVSHSEEEDLTNFCLFNPNAESTESAKDQWALEVRKTVKEIDNTIGSFVSEAMCSHLCPCDFDEIPVEKETQWLELFADAEKLAVYDRCNKGDAGCETEKEIILYKGVDTLNEILTEMDEYKI